MEISNYIFVPTSITIIINILPAISFINFFSNKASFDSIPIARIVGNYINSISFFFYSAVIFNIEARFANLLSAIISFILIIIYFILELSRNLLDSILNFIILVIGTSCCRLWLSKIIIQEIYVGRIYMITNLTSIFIQLQYIFYGIYKKDYSLIPITYDSISFTSYFSWIIYGIFAKDFYLKTTNLICCIVCLIQILLYFYYRNEYLKNVGEETTIEMDEIQKKDFSSIEDMKERPVKIETNTF